jgi:hypothetical protein
MLLGIARVVVPDPVPEEVPVPVVDVVHVVPVLDRLVAASLAVLVIVVIGVRLLVEDVADLGTARTRRGPGRRTVGTGSSRVILP